MTAMVLRHGFGEQHQNYADLHYSGYVVGKYDKYTPEATKEQLNFEARVLREEQCLNTSIRELELTLPDESSNQAPTRPSSDIRSLAKESNALIDLFISHSSADLDIATVLIELVRSALPGLHPTRIRCTSVAGYKLEGGSDTNNQLRKELRGSRVFIGLLTKQSLQSTYVLFELGARWGAETPFLPLVAAGLQMSDLRAPLSGLHSHSCDTETDLHQMLDEIGRWLSLEKASPAVYNSQLKKLAALSNEEGSRRLEPEPVVASNKTTNVDKRLEELRKRALAILRALPDNLPPGYLHPSDHEYLKTFDRALELLQEAGYDVGDWRLSPGAVDTLDDSMLRSKIDAVLLYFDMR